MMNEYFFLLFKIVFGA